MAVPRRQKTASRKERPRMPDPASHDSIDLEKVRLLGELMEKFDLSEVSLRKGGEHWRLRRGALESSFGGYPPPPPPPPHAPPPVAAPVRTTPAAVETADAGLLEIKSPTVGTFYPCPSEGEPPFVSVGSKVTPTTVVCLIEAMKVFNPIPAEVSGTIAAVLVKNGEAVEFGQPLFKVRP